jgi:hypothetical protein
MSQHSISLFAAGFYVAVPGVMASRQIVLCWNVQTEDSPSLANQ